MTGDISWKSSRRRRQSRSRRSRKKVFVRDDEVQWVMKSRTRRADSPFDSFGWHLKRTILHIFLSSLVSSSEDVSRWFSSLPRRHDWNRTLGQQSDPHERDDEHLQHRISVHSTGWSHRVLCVRFNQRFSPAICSNFSASRRRQSVFFPSLKCFLRVNFAEMPALFSTERTFLFSALISIMKMFIQRVSHWDKREWPFVFVVKRRTVRFYL